MLDKINSLIKSIQDVKIESSEKLEEFKLTYLSKKGLINSLFNDFRNLPNEKKKSVGQKLNELKLLAINKYNSLKSNLENTNTRDNKIDLTLPGYSQNIGSRHPVSLVRNEIIDIFKYLGFTISEGPEIEDDWHNFESLNFPPEHPARDMQDTFFIDNISNILLRTHTSSIQVRVMEKEKPPIRTISIGRCFRNEAISARAHCIFHQIEGLYIDENVSFADLKQTLLYFAHEFFGKETKIKLRPSYFPFTEPSAEMDISCTICKGKGCKVCKNTGWLEILGCGMVDPAVLENNNINLDKYTGYAFGMGIERVAMLKYQIKDIRLFFENDIRFLNQFSRVF